MANKARRSKRPKHIIRNRRYAILLQRCRELPPTSVINSKDYVTNLLITVLDLRLETKIVERALEFYRINRSKQIRTFDQLKNLLESDIPDIDIAIQLWGYRYGRRVATLRRLVQFFESQRITTQAALKAWATSADFERDFKDRIPGLAYAAFKWLVMRLGIDTIKPDVHILAFVEAVIGKRVSDTKAVAILEKAARDLGIPAAHLDARIWAHQRGLRAAVKSSR